MIDLKLKYKIRKGYPVRDLRVDRMSLLGLRGEVWLPESKKWHSLEFFRDDGKGDMIFYTGSTDLVEVSEEEYQQLMEMCQPEKLVERVERQQLSLF